MRRTTRRERGETADSARAFIPFGPYWSPDGRYAVLDVRTYDNKDRWIARLDPATGAVTSLDRQRDEAWIAGPGISWWGGTSSVGWLPDSETFWFQSEASGYQPSLHRRRGDGRRRADHERRLRGRRRAALARRRLVVFRQQRGLAVRVALLPDARRRGRPRPADADGRPQRCRARTRRGLARDPPLREQPPA